MEKLIGKYGVYTITSNEEQKNLIDYYPVSVIAIIEVLKRSKVTKSNRDTFKELFEDIPVCNNIAHLNNKAIGKENLVDHFWKSNTRIKEFIFLENLNHNHKIGLSYTQYITLKLLCDFDPEAERKEHDTMTRTIVKIENNTDIMIVNLEQMRRIVYKTINTWNAADLRDFLKQIPVCVNFIIDYEKNGENVTSVSLYCNTPYMREPSCQNIQLTFKMCIEMNRITKECEIGLSIQQYETFKKLCDW